MEGLTEGRIVHYVLTKEDVEYIDRRRVPRAGHYEGWPAGAQAHVGNLPSVGDHLPAIVVWVVNKERGYVNMQVFLDGNDSYWATSREYSELLEPGTWHWIERA